MLLCYQIQLKYALLLMPNKQGAPITSFGKILDSPCSLSTLSTQFIFSEFSNEGKNIYSNITS